MRLAVFDRPVQGFARLPVHDPPGEPELLNSHGVEGVGQLPALGGDRLAAGDRGQKRRPGQNNGQYPAGLAHGSSSQGLNGPPLSEPRRKPNTPHPFSAAAPTALQRNGGPAGRRAPWSGRVRAKMSFVVGGIVKWYQLAEDAIRGADGPAPRPPHPRTVTAPAFRCPLRQTSMTRPNSSSAR